MTAAEVLGSLRRRGIVVVPSGDGRLRVRPRDALTAAECEDLARHRDAILALFDADPIGWRAAAMAAQLPRSGAIPLLLARPGAGVSPDGCCSCGDPLRVDERYRCRACAAAAVAALEALQ